MSKFTIDKCSPVQISTPLTDYPYAYEITCAFSDKTYTHAQAFMQIDAIQRYLREIFTPVESIEKLVFVTEYTKKWQPHTHIAIACSELLDPPFCHGVKQALVRLNKDTRVTFSHVASKQAYNDYLEKDLDKNLQKSGLAHKHEFSR